MTKAEDPPSLPQRTHGASFALHLQQTSASYGSYWQPLALDSQRASKGRQRPDCCAPVLLASRAQECDACAALSLLTTCSQH